MRLAKRYTAHARGHRPPQRRRRLDRVAHAAVSPASPGRTGPGPHARPGAAGPTEASFGALASALGTRAGQCQAAGQAYVEDLACGKAREKVGECPKGPSPGAREGGLISNSPDDLAGFGLWLNEMEAAAAHAPVARASLSLPLRQC